MRVVFIRHLCTPGNEKRQYIGRTDEDLSPRAAEALRLRLRENPGGIYPAVQCVVSSPLKRCIRTAGLIYPGQEPVIEPMLRECDFGEYEGKTYEELKNRPEYIRWLESGGMTAFPGGEEQTDFRRRCACGVENQIDRLIDEGAESAAFVVHGGTIMAALSGLAEHPGDFYRWQAENGGGYTAEVSEKEWKSGGKILRNIKKIS